MTAEVHRLQTRNHFSKADNLLKSLVPHAQTFCFYDLTRASVWNSESADDYELDEFVAAQPQELYDDLIASRDVVRRTLPSGRIAVLLPVYCNEQLCIGILLAVFARSAGKSPSFHPNVVRDTLRPALDLMGERLHVGVEKQAAERRADEVEKELRFVYDIDEKILCAAGQHSSLAQIVGRSGRYLGINYSVLLIPSKRIRISATHSSWKNVNRKVVDRYLIEQLLPKLDGQRYPIVIDVPARPGAASAYQALLCPVLDVHGNVEGVLAQIGRIDLSRFSQNDRRFMSHIARKVEYVIEQSFDVMTGLMNRAGFEAQIEESFGTLEAATDQHQIIYFDLDNLQLVNDTFGRKAGDEVIVRFARLLEEDLPNSGVLSRLTGDDFCMLLTHSDSETALRYANGVRDKISALRYLEGDKSLQLTMSVGITAFDNSNRDMSAVMTTARMACEAAKAHGRDRVEIYDETNRSAIRRFDDMQLVASIQQALDADEFELMAQPIDLLDGGGRCPKFEVLLRMNDTDGGYVSTLALFSAAERYRMMPAIDRWVVTNTLATLVEFSEAVLERDAVFSMNLSGQSLSDDDFLAFVEEEIAVSRLPASCLGFEITESAAVSNLEKAQAFIDRLAALGCHISLDDFGAGLSSFAYLKNFRVDTLKIDGSFIRDITENRISESMVAAITQVAKVMQLRTVAEYVETEETRRLLSDLGVDYAQGHIVGKPTPLISVLSGQPKVLSSAG